MPFRFGFSMSILDTFTDTGTAKPYLSFHWRMRAAASRQTKRSSSSIMPLSSSSGMNTIGLIRPSSG